MIKTMASMVLMTLKLSWLIHQYKRFFGALENIWFIDRKSKAKIGAHKNETQRAIGTKLTLDSAARLP